MKISCEKGVSKKPKFEKYLGLIAKLFRKSDRERTYFKKNNI